MFSYTNRREVTYYIHEVRTKAGGRRYTANRAAEGALPELPAGLEIVENVNGLVSVRTARARVILPLEEQLVQQALKKYGRVTYRAEVKGRYIVIHEPLRNAAEMAERFDPEGFMAELGLNVGKMIRESVGKAAWDDYRRQKKEQVRQELERTMQYWPVLRFRIDDVKRRRFSAERMGYSGEGGWLGLDWDLTLDAACDQYVPLLGTDKLFEV